MAQYKLDKSVGDGELLMFIAFYYYFLNTFKGIRDITYKRATEMIIGPPPPLLHPLIRNGTMHHQNYNSLARWTCRTINLISTYLKHISEPTSGRKKTRSLHISSNLAHFAGSLTLSPHFPHPVHRFSRTAHCGKNKPKITENTQ